MKAKKLIEVALPIKEIGAESSRDGRLARGHVKSIHQWWARRPLPTCRAVVFASLVPDPLDCNCTKAFKEAVVHLLSEDFQYKPYYDIPYTAIVDTMPDNLRNRLMMFIGKFSGKAQQNLKQGKSTPPAELLTDGSLIKWENKNNSRILNIARELIFVAYNAEISPNVSYETLHNRFVSYMGSIKEAQDCLYAKRDRHIKTSEVLDAEKKLKDCIDAFQNNMPSVFDPFAGGGTIPLEAARLGCRSFGNDINPVAHIIERCSAEYPQKYGKRLIISKNEFSAKYGERGKLLAEELGVITTADCYDIPNILSFDINFYARLILEKAESEIGHLYPDSEDGRKTIAYLWAREATCSNPSCRAKVPILKGFYLSSSKDKQIKLMPIINGNHIDFTIEKGVDATASWQNRGNITCPCCGSITSSDIVKQESTSYGLKHRLLAVIRNGKNGKEYDLPTQREIEIANRDFEISYTPQQKLEKEYTQALPVCTWGITEWGQLFTKRQLLAINTLIKYFKEISYYDNTEYTKVVKSCLAMWIDRVIRYNTSFSNYETGNEKLNRILVRQEIHMIFDFPESNPFCGIAGSALNQLDCILESVENESCHEFFAQFNNSSSGEKSQFESKSINAVVTDPPYYDAMAYADLSDFYYVWLKEMLTDEYPMIFATPQTPKAEECTALKHHHNGSDKEAELHFEHKLTQIFDAIESETRDIVSIMFAHQSTKAWTTLCNSILSARMNISGSWPMDTESKAGVKMDKAFLGSSVTVACRPALRQGYGEYKEVKNDIEQRVSEEVASLYDLGFRGADLLTACFGQAVSEFGRYKSVEKSNGDDVSVAELLELAKTTAFNALLRGIEGDEETRFYVGWLQMNGMGDTDFDDASKFTRVGVNVEIKDILSQNLLIRDKKKQHLASAVEHIGDISLYHHNTNDTLITVVHKAMILYKRENQSQVINIIADYGKEPTSQFWRILATLSELLPACDDLKQVQGLLQNAETLRQKSKETVREQAVQTTIDFGE